MAERRLIKVVLLAGPALAAFSVLSGCGDSSSGSKAELTLPANVYSPAFVPGLVRERERTSARELLASASLKSPDEIRELSEGAYSLIAAK